MNKKGFVFIEMIVTTVILIVALLLLYTTYSRIISNEKQRLYYDDIAYIYKAEKIRDVIATSIDYNNFYKKVNNNENGYVYLFGPDSDIWQSTKKSYVNGTVKSNILLLWDEYNINAMGYIDIDDIEAVKKCFGDDKTGFDEEKCEATKTHLKAYSKTTIENYLKTIDVYYEDGTEKNFKNHQAVLVILFGEKKNGKGINTESTYTYSKCIQDYANIEGYGYNVGGSVVGNPAYDLCDDDNDPDKDCNDANTLKGYAVKAYNKDDKTSFDMLCENAYNIVWVYF